MRISESCAKCLYDRQLNKTDNAEYLAKIKDLLDNRSEDDTSPYMVYLFNKVHVKYFGKGADYKDIKKQYNDLILGMENDLRREIEKSPDPLAKGQGNYESMSGQGRHVFYAFLCKCDLFTNRFHVPRLTGIFVQEC